MYPENLEGTQVIVGSMNMGAFQKLCQIISFRKKRVDKIFGEYSVKYSDDILYSILNWARDDIPSDLTPEPRRQVMSKNNSLRFENVSTGDSQMLQCMASNEHGDIIANIAFNVLGKKGTWN